MRFILGIYVYNCLFLFIYIWRGEGRVSHHRSQSLQIFYQSIHCKVKHIQIKWPKVKWNNEWQHFDADISGIIITASKVNADRRLQILLTIIVMPQNELANMRKESYTNKRRAEMILGPRREFRALLIQKHFSRTSHLPKYFPFNCFSDNYDI